jgi:hypothetical protein
MEFITRRIWDKGTWNLRFIGSESGELRQRFTRRITNNKYGNLGILASDRAKSTFRYLGPFTPKWRSDEGIEHL